MKRKKKNDNASIVYGETGMSQMALAQYIGAKTSTLSHHLAGTRLLPGEAGLKLMNLIVKLVQLPQQPLVQTLSTEEKKKLKEAADWCRTQCIPLQKKLETMQDEAAKAARLIHLVTELEKEEGEISEDRQRWYSSQRGGAEYQLYKNSRYQLLQLEVKIAVLQKEAEMYEAQLTEV